MALHGTFPPLTTTRTARHGGPRSIPLVRREATERQSSSCRILSIASSTLIVVKMSHSHMDMNMGSSSSGSSSGSTGGSGMSMPMVFTTVHNTPLYSSTWTPTSTGAYAGTCIFLIVLAIISRSLHAWRQMLELRWHDRAVNRRYVAVADDGEQPAPKGGEKSDEAVLTVRGLDERVRVVRHSTRTNTPPWRLSVDFVRACVFALQAGVGYLL